MKSLTLIIVIIITDTVHLFTLDKKRFHIIRTKLAKKGERLCICIKAQISNFLIIFKILSKFQELSCGKVK